MSIPAASIEEKMEAVAFWKRHIEVLRQQGVRDDIITWVCCYAQPDSIGYEQGQIRPGNLGKHDMYSYLMESLSAEDLLIATGLTAAEVAAEDECDRLSNTYGIDPHDPESVMHIHALEGLTPEQLAAHINTLEMSVG